MIPKSSQWCKYLVSANSQALHVLAQLDCAVAAIWCFPCGQNAWSQLTSQPLMRNLLSAESRYALPLKVIECLVAHFCAFAGEDKILPLASRQRVKLIRSCGEGVLLQIRFGIGRCSFLCRLLVAEDCRSAFCFWCALT